MLHTIGGDDTNTPPPTSRPTCASNDYELTVVGLPKTIDNDVVPIRQSLGAWTAAEQGALFARNIIAEHTSNPRMLIVHEVMGRNCGWLTAATARAYHQWVAERGVRRVARRTPPRRWDVHARLRARAAVRHRRGGRAAARRSWTSSDCVNLFLSEGAGVGEIVAAMEAAGEEVPRDPFGHVQLDKINPGAVVRQAVRRASSAPRR